MALLTHHLHDRSRLPAIAVVAVVTLTGCGAPPELSERSSRRSSPATGTPSATVPPTLVPPTAVLPQPTLPAPPTTGAVAVACASGPSGRQVVRLVRGAAGVLPRDTVVRVSKGPLCADDWHYTVLAVTGYEDLLVVTRARPDALTLVTAGTDVCTIEVRTAAPAGIRTLACEGTVGVPGA